MRSTTALWFHIETTFTEIQELCVQARAAQLAQTQTKAFGAGIKRTMVSTGGPGDDDIDTSGEDPRLARAAVLARDMSFREENAGGPNLVGLREQIRRRLKRLEGRLAEVLSDYDRYYALFPIVVYVDELVQLGTRGEVNRWQPLQGELFDEENGGETFYTTLDEKLSQTETHPMVLEIYYFCLSDGFVGVYKGDPKKIEEYKANLIRRIPVQNIETSRAQGPKSVQLISFPWPLYVVAVLLVIATHVLLSWLAAPAS